MLTKQDLEQIDILLERRIKPMKSDVVKIRKDISMIVSYFDREYLDLRKRVERIEDKLNLPPLS